MKRSQTEIFGLAFIVILIIMGIFFGLFFFVGKKEPPSKGVESILAANWLNTAMNTFDPQCQEATLRELYQNCAQTNSLRCSTGHSACERARIVTEQMLQGTFGQWNRKYYLTTSINNFDPFGTKCKGERESKTQFIALPGQEPISIQLDICR